LALFQKRFAKKQKAVLYEQTAFVFKFSFWSQLWHFL